MRFPKGLAAATLVLAIGAGGSLATNVGAKDEPSTPGGRVVKELNLSKPGQVNRHAVWRNGKYHFVNVNAGRKVRTYENGYSEEVVSENAADVAAATQGIPPPDPALANVKPTPEQEAEADRMLGLDVERRRLPGQPDP